MEWEKMKQFGSSVTRLINKEDIPRGEMRDIFSMILRDETTEMHQGAFLAALTAKGETAEEIAGVWEAIYDIDTVKAVPDVNDILVDNCGTGMDAVKTFNISTAASIIAAADGINIARHGARAITSVCGTVDILETLGVDVECPPQYVKNSIEQTGIGIYNGMSPQVHPQALGRILSKLAFGSVLNISASLANPALPKYGVRGVYSPDMLLPVANVMKEIGYQKALVIHGLDAAGIHGMDEASTLGKTLAAELTPDGNIREFSFLPEDFGLQRLADPNILSPAVSRETEARHFLALIAGKDNGPRQDIICLNAALIFYLTGKSTDIAAGIEKARRILKDGLALDKLRQWVQAQNSNPDAGTEKLNTLLRQAG